MKPAGRTQGPAPLARIVVVGRLAVGVWRYPSLGATSLVRASTGWSTTTTLGRLGQEPGLVEVMLDRMDQGYGLAEGWNPQMTCFAHVEVQR